MACAAALAALDQIEREGLLARADAIGATMRERLESFRERFEVIGEVRGLGAMVAMELVEDRGTREPARDAAARLLADCHREGLVLLKAGTYDNVIRLLPPLTISQPLLEEGLGIIEKALATGAAA